MENNELTLLRNIVQGIPELVIVVSEHGMYLEIAGISEHDPEEVVGKSLTELFPQSVANQFTDALNTAFSLPSEQVSSIEYTLYPSDDLKIKLTNDIPRTFELKINPLSTTYNGARLAVCICRDVTQYREYEQQLIELSEKDHMTGIFNRTKLLERLEISFHQFRRYQTPSCFILFDIDEFKEINDKYGHLVGDKAICHVVSICSNEHRLSDTFARLGGDEFAMLLPNIGLDEAAVLVERLTKAIRKTPFVYNESIIPITISIGISEIDENDAGIEDVMHRADEDMYCNKFGKKKPLAC